MKQSRLSLLLALTLAAAAPALASDDISKVNGSISAEAGRQYRDLETVNGSITVAAGVQARNVETVNGGVRIGDNAQVRNVETVNGSIRLGRGVTGSGDLETVNGSVFVDQGSRIAGGVETVNGSIGLVGTQLGKGIETVNGDITVGVGSQVQGGIRVKKSGFSLSLKPPRTPRVIVGPDAVVEGPLEFEREVTLYVHRSAKIGPVTGATVQTFDTDTAPRD